MLRQNYFAIHIKEKTKFMISVVYVLMYLLTEINYKKNNFKIMHVTENWY